MKKHDSDKGWLDSAGDHYIFVGRELRKINNLTRTFDSRDTHSIEANAFQDGWNEHRKLVERNES
jgi:hypothetical protein